MELLIALAASATFAIALRTPLKACPVAFYAAAVLVAAGFASHAAIEAAPALGRALFPYVQRCLFAFGLLTVVMFIGVLPEGSKLRRHLNPVRGELSIVASIFVAGHVANYAQSYLSQLARGIAGMPLTTLASFGVSAVLVALLALLAITSFNVVRKRMDAGSWKRLQLLAYPFYALIYAHLALILAPSASNPEQKAFVSIVVYTAVMALYAMTRAARAAATKKGGRVRGADAAVEATEAEAVT